MPSWLIPEDKDVDPDNPDTRAQQSHAQLVAEGKRARLHLDSIAYEAIFERALLDIAAGQPLSATLEADHRSIDYHRFLAWVHKDENRKAQYYQAQEIGAEVVAAQMLEIADADDTLEDVQRSTLRINTRKWLLGVWNRKRFGEVKQIEQNVTIDLGEAMAQAQARVDNRRTVDVTAREIP
jgi:hypothetical protein